MQSRNLERTLSTGTRMSFCAIVPSTRRIIFPASMTHQRLLSDATNSALRRVVPSSRTKLLYLEIMRGYAKRRELLHQCPFQTIMLGWVYLMVRRLPATQQ